jgi:carboxylesterase type B
VLQVTAFGGKSPPLFQQAIAESFPVGTGFLSHNSFNGFQSVVNSIGCSNPDEELAVSCLRNLPFETLLNISLTVADTISPFSASPGALSFSPVVDGDFIPSLPSELLQTGQFSPTGLIIGWNNDDANVFTPTSIQTEMDIANTLLQITPGLTSKLFQSCCPSIQSPNLPASQHPTSQVSGREQVGL